MRIIPLIQAALRAMKANKARTGLTVLGMVIGISSVIIVFSAGEGINNLVLGMVESFGTDFIETEIKVPSTKKGTASETQSATALVQGVQITSLTLDDMEDIDRLSNIKKSYGGIIGQEPVSYSNELTKSILLGVTASFIEIDQSEIEEGRFFSDAEDKSLTQVVVLGSKIKEKLFGDSDPLGKSIKIRKSKYRVIGILKERGVTFAFDWDNIVYLPVRTTQKKIMGIDHVVFLFHKLVNVDLTDETAEEIRYILRENHDISDPGKDDFRVVSMAESLEILNTVTGAMTWLILAIVAISLIVGGVGIMNIMYVIVSERRPEIGLRKAVGAKYTDIMLQFLVESVIITLAGGVAGVIIGVLVSGMVAIGANSFGLDWGFSVPLRAFVVALVFSSFFGILFGVYPARKAAKMDPIEALRSN